MRSVTRTLARRIGRRAEGTCGMTLIEVMVAAVILLVAMAGIVPLFVSGLSQSSTIRMRSIATNLAREKMEQIRQLDYREIYTDAMKASDATLGDRTLEYLFGTAETVRNADFTIDYVVNDQSYQQGTLKEVTVNVEWAAPPAVSPASITTLVHQQFLGPRGSSLEILSTDPDPLGSPFGLLRNTHNTTVKYHVAQADWSLIFYDPSSGTPTLRDSYMRLAMVDDLGQAMPLGNKADDYKIDSSHVEYTTDGSGKLTDVWFEYSFDEATIPDGYWVCRAVLYNGYDEPGNTWRLRLRIEKTNPDAPTDLVATPQAGDQSIVLNWLSGSERDRDHWVIERAKWDDTTGSTFPWTIVIDSLDPRLSSYTDVGYVDGTGAAIDPWGDASTKNYYYYRVWAVDSNDPGQAGPAAEAATYIPDPSTTTTSLVSTTSTIAPPSTTTTTSLVLVEVDNNTGTSYEVTFVGAHQTYTFTAKPNKNKINVIGGDWYQVTVAGLSITGSFQAGTTPNPVFQINLGGG